MIQLPAPRWALLPALLVLGLMAVSASPARALEERVAGKMVVGPEGAEEVSVAAGSVVVNGPVTGDVEVGWGEIEVNAPVGGDVEVGRGDVHINGRVEGDVEVGHGDVTRGPGAAVEGAIRCDGCVVSPSPDAGMESTAVGASASGVSHAGSRLPDLAGWLLATLCFVALSVLAAIVMPRPLAASARRIEASPGWSLLAGLLSVPVALVLFAVLAISVVGIPALLLLVPAYLVLMLFGVLAAAYYTGRRLLLSVGGHRGGHALAAVVGASVVSVVHVIPLLGNLILSALALLGAGAALLALLSRRPGFSRTSY